MTIPSTRRRLLVGASLAAAATALPLNLLAQAAPTRQRFSLQTYSLKELNLHHLVPVLRSLGIDSVELYDRHLSPTASLADFTRGLRELRDAGIVPQGLYTERFHGDPGSDERIFRLCYLAGIETIVSALPDAVAAPVAAQARDWGMRLALHNPTPGDGADMATPEAIANRLEAVEAADLCLDIGNLARGGFDPVAAVEGFGPRIRSVHVKDVDADGGHVRLGTGQIDLDQVFDALDRHAPQAHPVLEYGGQPDDIEARIEALATNVEWLRARVNGS